MSSSFFLKLRSSIFHSGPRETTTNNMSSSIRDECSWWMGEGKGKKSFSSSFKLSYSKLRLPDTILPSYRVRAQWRKWWDLLKAPRQRIILQFSPIDNPRTMRADLRANWEWKEALMMRFFALIHQLLIWRAVGWCVSRHVSGPCESSFDRTWCNHFMRRPWTSINCEQWENWKCSCNKWRQEGRRSDQIIKSSIKNIFASCGGDEMSTRCGMWQTSHESISRCYVCFSFLLWH